jgi:hypothetical protein
VNVPSILKPNATTYSVSLDTMRRMIAADLGVDEKAVSVTYTIDCVDERMPDYKTVVGIEVRVTSVANDGRS